VSYGLFCVLEAPTQEISAMRSLQWESVQRVVLYGLVAMLAIVFDSGKASASILGLGEQDEWSDMAFPTGVTGDFTGGVLTLSASPSNSLEIGGEFGPSNPGRHYGTLGTLGGPFGATLNVSGVVIAPDGTVTTGGSVVITFNGGSLAADYGIAPGAVLLSGTVLEVMLDAMGDNTLDILFSISGGALQTNNPASNVGVFSSVNLGLLRVSEIMLPSDFSGDFSLNGATVDVFGATPEASITTLAFFAGILSWVCTSRRCYSDRATQ
jgi:hypothetical protein